MSYVIARPAGGTSANGNEFDRDASGNILEFHSRLAAWQYLFNNGYTLESMDAEGITVPYRDSAEEKYIRLDTFPKCLGTSLLRFVVEKDWLLSILESLDSFHLRKGVDLENFLNNYDYSETDLIRELATGQGKILHEEDVVDV